MPIDYTRYPPMWRNGIVPRILLRANNCCEFCGLADAATVYHVALEVTKGPRYKTRRIWVSTETDRKRLESFRCGGIPAKSVTVVLTVAHLDHDEENHEVSDDRLKALCQYCHLNYDASEKYRRAIAKAEEL